MKGFNSRKLYTEAAQKCGLYQLSDKQSQDLKVIMLNIVKDVLSVCDKHGLELIMCGGTLLGAVRHSGFIPWDDDMDFWMIRKHYNKLIEVFNIELGEKYVLQVPQTEPNASNGFMKIRLKDTAFVEVESEGMPIHKGIFIDIFPVENVPQRGITRLFHGYKCILSRHITVSTALYKYPSKSMLQLAKYSNKLKFFYTLRRCLGLVFSVRPVGFWTKMTDNICAKYQNIETELLTVPYGGRRYFNEIMLREKIYPLTKLRFEDIDLYAPKEWEEYLCNRYGNYMELPEENKREKHWVVKVEY